MNEGDGRIYGQAVALDIPDSQWPILDALNGCQMESTAARNYIIKQNVVVIEGELLGTELCAYGLNPQKKLQTIGPVADTENLKLEAELLFKLTDRQKNYIHKLAKVKGREVVPIDLAISRELISLQLIVDKGRRLALTNLGQEVSCFL